jgi:polar amino acid transport system permease protein
MLSETETKGRLLPISFENTPWWALILALIILLAVGAALFSQVYRDTVRFLISGVKMTIALTVVSYTLALILGLLAGLGRVSKSPILYTLGTLYVEIIRGIPLLVLLLYIGYVVAPPMHISNLFTRGVLGLGIGYGAYLAEVFRAGIESIGKGQMEAARSLGMSYTQAMRYVILPQAFRTILPPLGNNLVAMLKDTSLVSVLSIRDLTYLGRLNVSRTFRTFATWNMVALMYLIMTIGLSLLVRWTERKTSFERR